MKHPYHALSLLITLNRTPIVLSVKPNCTLHFMSCILDVSCSALMFWVIEASGCNIRCEAITGIENSYFVKAFITAF